MVFSSVIFCYIFLPIVLITYIGIYIVGKKLKLSKNIIIQVLNVIILLFSLIFYAWGEPKNIVILILCTALNFFVAQAIQKLSYKRVLLFLGVTLNLSLLLYYKYAMLLFSGKSLEIINSTLPDSWFINDVLNIALPLGISFYIFQAISYLIDVYRQDVAAEKSFVNFACYLTMFPQLVAGPIVRYSQVEKELKSRTIDSDLFASGASRFIIGLVKKILIADTLGIIVDSVFDVTNTGLEMSAAWFGIISYTFQIYYDFSGYSDMAIGMGKMFGFSFPENFNYPYIASSIQDFWRRWHMSLSTWFKDYLYIPLGGSRNGKLRTYINLIIVFALCGFWHGASWNFLAWGVYYGFFLILERLFPNILKIIPKILRHFYVIAVVLIGWVLFRADSFTHAYSYCQALFGYSENTKAINLQWSGATTIAFISAVVFSTPVYRVIKNFCTSKVKSTNENIIFIIQLAHYFLLLVLFLFCVYPIFGATYKSFIYFRF